MPFLKQDHGLGKSIWPRTGDTRPEGKSTQVYYRGDWKSRRGEDSYVKGDRVVTRKGTDPDYKAGMQTRARQRKLGTRKAR